MASVDTLDQLTECLDSRQSFKLEAGAGSGKTYSLVYALRHLLGTQRRELEQSGRSIACITYTNAAKNEIRRRVAQDPLVRVHTIHEFLWSIVQPYQTQLRQALIDHNQGAKVPVDGLEDALTPDVAITYSDRRRDYSAGVISHDEVIKLSHRLIASHPRLARITTDQYPYIFVDEYQDTFPETVDVLLENLLAGREDKLVVGLFGDSMQKIFQAGVGAVASDKLKTITKHDNFRSSHAVVAVLNKIRPELPQVVTGPDREGEAWLFADARYSAPEERLASAQRMLTGRGWQMDSTKHLYLTHRLIAGTLGYRDLDQLYAKRGRSGRDDLLEGREPYCQLLQRIEAVRRAHEANDQAALLEHLGDGDVTITRHRQKAEITRSLQQLSEFYINGSIGQVVDSAHNRRIVFKPSAVRDMESLIGRTELDERDQRRAIFYEALRALPYRQWANFAQFREDQTPYSTQHSVKGAEFDDVLVVVDDGAWNQFDMGKMIAGIDKPERTERSRNMFYVCCSRARNRLAVVFLTDLPKEAVPVVKDWFGAERVIL